MAKRSYDELLACNFKSARLSELNEAGREKFGKTWRNVDTIQDALAALRNGVMPSAVVPVAAPQSAAPARDVQSFTDIIGEREAPPELEPTTIPPGSDFKMTTVTAAGIGRLPNLGSVGKWQGRMRRVTIHKMDQMSGSEALQVGWDGVIWTIAYEQTVDMPWPYWESLRNTDFIDDRSEKVTEWVRDDEKRLFAVRTPRRIPTVSYTDHGDVPGTEAFPRDYTEYFRNIALKSQCFGGYNRAALVTVYNIVIERRDAEFFRSMSDYDIRVAIASRLGPDVERLMMDVVFEQAG